MRARAWSVVLLALAPPLMTWSAARDTPAGTASARERAARVDFDRAVRPLLPDRCFPCHGPDAAAREAELRLDDPVAARAERDGVRAIVPGDAQASELVARILHDDPEERMPPADSGRKPLSEAEKQVLTRWISEGAEYAPHWAFVPPHATAPPTVRDADWCLDPLDRYVLARLEVEQLSPSPEAERGVWLRRVSLDLTGLPSTPEEAATFLADAQPGAHERVVDRLLASSRFGERMASEWMDLARYADTYGYQSDVYRPMWRWRDWVIEAFNQNLPYSDFLTYQLAGDLLPDATREQRLATAFNRLHRMTNEGGSVEEEFRVEYVADRVQTFSTTFLGLTMECARCHDHKYDPLPTRDYYRLAAYFDDIDESGLYSHFTDAVPTPTLALATPEQERALATAAEDIAAAERALAARVQAARGEFEAWRAAGGRIRAPAPIAHYPLDEIGTDGTLGNLTTPERPGRVLDAPQSIVGARGGALRFSGDDNASFPGVAEFAHTDAFSFVLWMRAPTRLERAVVLRRSRSWTDAGSQGYQLLIEDGRLTWSLIHFWPGNAASVRTREEFPLERWVEVALTHDGSGTAAGLRVFLDGAPVALELVRDGLWKPITGGDPGALTLAERFRDVGFAGGGVDELRVYERCLAPAEVAEIHAPGAAALASDEESFTAWLAAHDEAHRSALAPLKSARVARAQLLAGVEEIMTMTATPTPRAAYVLLRGRYDHPDLQQPVSAGTPTALPPVPTGAPEDRLGVAQWLTQDAHPLTARVAVNRLWALMFGVGLVETRENFGVQGKPPSHPELLDALALEFIASDWNVKGMLRRIALSASYRQSSRVRAELARTDPEDRLLGRFPPRRLSAEQIRDQALAVSGLLMEKIGGPSVRPWQPPGLWSIGAGGEYRPDAGEGRWRRSLYTYWRRTIPPPSMLLFDAATRDVCSARRQETSTPLQALALMNDPQLTECARVLAARVAREAGADPDARIARAFALLCGRAPSTSELAALRGVYDAQLAEYRADPAAAAALLAVGVAPNPPDADPADLAACVLACSVLFSADAALVLR